MKRLAVLATALGLAVSGSVLAETPAQKADTPKDTAVKKPTAMTDQEMDKVTAGALINATVIDLVDVQNNNVAVAVPVNAAVAVGVLGGAVSGALQQPGRITQ